MRRWFFSLINLYIYSSLHIGLGAAALCFLSQNVIAKHADQSFLLFAFFSTILLYNLHRIIGIKKLEGQPDQGRFKIIRNYWSHILVYAVFALIGTIYFFMNLTWNQWIYLLLPGLISVLYILPVFTNALRLRDMPYIKIFLIAITWGAITTMIPLIDSTLSKSMIAFLTIERILFIFAITIPFDWRDAAIDKISGVKTIVHVLGPKRSLQLSLGLLLLCILIQLIFMQSGILSKTLALSFIVSYLMVGWIIYSNRKSTSDYVYSGWIDGSMLVPYILYNLL